MMAARGKKCDPAARRRKRERFTADLSFVITVITAITTGCQNRPQAIGTINDIAVGTASGNSSSDLSAEYKNANSVKVVFNKENFYNNFYTNNRQSGRGCAGDARYYFRPDDNRRVPTKPDWLTNVAVELTNSNATSGSNNSGPSYATSCSYSGVPNAANCATFDDLQPLSGVNSRSYVYGGIACSSGSCTIPGTYQMLNVPDDITAPVWTSASNPVAIRRAWHGGDFDILHNQLYFYGGITAGNYVPHPDAENNATTGYAAYQDAAAAQPTDGTGGAPTVTITTSSAAPIAGTYSFIITKDAANRIGEGVSANLSTINAIDQGKALTVSFSYKVTSGTYATGDITFWIVNVTAGTVQQCGTGLTNTAVATNFQCSFTTTSGMSNYRLAWHIATNSANAYTMMFDNVSVGRASFVTQSISALQLSSTETVTTADASANANSPIGDYNDPTDSSSLITNFSYAGWSSTGVSAHQTAPSPLFGHSFTYSLRRDVTTGTHCRGGDCPTALTAPSTNQVYSANDSNDYFLLLGGINSSLQVEPNTFFLYKPHEFTNDKTIGTVHGEWVNLYGDNSMAFASVAYNATAQSYVVNSHTPSTNPIWNGRAFHRTVYDPFMNRFYVFGGLEPADPATTKEISGTAPVLSDNYVWIYNPPALGRRPTSACGLAKHPDGTNILSSANSAAAQKGILTDGAAFANVNLGEQRNFLAAPEVFPPGGCLEQMRLDTTDSASPDRRFEHAMAFDLDRRAVLLFGGCKNPAKIPGMSTANAGDPTSQCDTSDLLHDTWLYLPPRTTEYVGTGRASLPNPFGIDFSLDGLPLFSGMNTPSDTAINAPLPHQALGVWIKLDPTTKPTPRASAGMIYDRAHHKFYLQGGYGCTSVTASGACQSSTTPEDLSDLWEFTPPNVEDECNRETGTCATNGTWRLAKATKADGNTGTGQPTARKGMTFLYVEPVSKYGDEFYTITDTACLNQGPVSSQNDSGADPFASKREVGAIYIDFDSAALASSGGGILINLRFLPYDRATKLPAVQSTGYSTIDSASSDDTAIIRVQLLKSVESLLDRIWSMLQPRFHDFMLDNNYITKELMQVTAGTGQVTEKQLYIPLSDIDPDVNLIRLQREQGSVKFFEMTITKF